MFFTLDAVIAELEKMRATHGSTCQIGIEDADTDWTLPIKEISFDVAEKRVLVKGDYHGDEFPARPAQPAGD